ncbi:MAG: 2-C-methyl-D-erythritol 2,4-cyclodiphosphate synthase [Mogibacterium sp.]|nr:2-C-methyl-D-erythritol 2,4-cyclodiphosphate synthase [Mogibacterium sp.]
MDYSKVYAIVVAAGRGLRVGTAIPKQLLRYEESTVLEHTVKIFATHPRVDGVVVVGPEDGSFSREYREAARRIMDQTAVTVLVTRGGAERSDSVQRGLEAAEALAVIQKAKPAGVCVMIHDAARPGVDHAIIDRNLEGMKTCQAVVTCVPATDSIRTIDQTSLKQDKLYPIIDSNVLERNLVYCVQTPQTFGLEDIMLAYVKAAEDGYVGTDDASVADNAGISVAIVEGSPSNYKITTAKDVPMTTRTGTGFDVHKLVSGRNLILCGTPVPYELGLLGHSDADVATHAIMDALLGAAGKGDIGIHFPDNDDKYKDANSLELLAEVKKIIGDVTVSNVDVTIIAQRPKLAPYNQQMKENIAKTLGIPEACVNVKATTTEGLGFTGQGEGIAAFASCAIEGSF